MKLDRGDNNWRVTFDNRYVSFCFLELLINKDWTAGTGTVPNL
jgi:hypothetical protein